MTYQFNIANKTIEKELVPEGKSYERPIETAVLEQLHETNRSYGFQLYLIYNMQTASGKGNFPKFELEDVTGTLYLTHDTSTTTD